MWCCLRNLTKCLQLSYLLAISKVTLFIHMVVQLLPCLFFSARALGSHRGNYGDHEVHSVYWQCISMLYFRSFPQGCYKTYEPHLVGLITDGSTGDFFPLEHAEILCSMSFFLVKGSLSEQSRLFHQVAIMRHFYIWQSGYSSSGCLLNCLGFITFCRDVCCCLSSVQMFDVVTWLLKAFVLTTESPSLCQEVCGVILVFL
jgi:separase